jgi:hypothetical protein
MNIVGKWILILSILLLVGGCAANIPDANDLPDTNQSNSYKQVGNQVTKTDTARFNGQIDINSIEVNISGVPEGQGVQALRLSEPVKQVFSSYQLKTGDTVKFEYYLNQQGQKVVTKLEVITVANSDTKTESGRFWGKVTGDSIEIKISGVPDIMPPRVFGLSEQIRSDFPRYNLQQGDVIKFDYITDASSKPVIVKMERI